MGDSTLDGSRRAWATRTVEMVRRLYSERSGRPKNVGRPAAGAIAAPQATPRLEQES